jgi:hypothetical protein
MKQLKLLILITLITNSVHGQVQLAGQVNDLFTGRPIKGAKVTVINKMIETTTDSVGQFSISTNISDSLIVECIGYYTQKLQVNKADNLIIKLENSFPIYLIVDEPTQFPGGLPKFYDYVKSNFKHPTKKQKHGKIFVEFVVDTSGLIMPNETKVLKAVNETLAKEIHETYDPEIIRVVNESPTWITARQRGKKVRQKMVLPISF